MYTLLQTKVFRSFNIPLFILLITITLAGCGGGDGDGDKTSPPEIPPSGGEISSGSVSGSVSGTSVIPGAKVTAKVDINEDGEIAASEVGGVSYPETYETRTDINGTFGFGSLPITMDGVPLRIVLHFEKDGYGSNTRILEVTGDTVVGIVMAANVSATDEDISDGFQFKLSQTGGVTFAKAGVHAKVNKTDTEAMVVNISQDAFPSGVTSVTGSALYVNPKRDPELFPGNFLAASGTTTSKAKADQAGSEVALESIVLSELVLKDQDGDKLDIGSISSTSDYELTMLVPIDTWSSLKDEDPETPGIQVPLYWFDEETGLWQAHSEYGILKDAPGGIDIPDTEISSIVGGDYNGDIYAEGKVNHFSWWNVDVPIDRRTCLCGQILDAEGTPIRDLHVWVESDAFASGSSGTTDENGFFDAVVMASDGGQEEYPDWRYGYDHTAAPTPSNNKGGSIRVKIMADPAGWDWSGISLGTSDTGVNWSDIGTPDLEAIRPGTESAPCRYIGSVTLPLKFNRKITGKIIKENGGTPFADIRIYASTGSNTLTGSNGSFILTVPANSPLYIYSPELFKSGEGDVPDISAGEDDLDLGDIVIPNNRPEIISTTAEPSNPDPGDMVTLMATASDPDENTLTYTWKVEDGGEIIGTNSTITWTAPSESGTYTIILTVSDGMETVSTSITVVVGTVNPEDFLNAALDALTNADILSAADLFKSASIGYGTEVSNNADTTRFFYAMTRVAAIWFDIASDGDMDNGLHTIGDIMDAFGCSEFGREPMEFEGGNDFCPDILPLDSPESGELQAYLYDVIRPELEGAIASLDAISQDFNKIWTEPFDSTTIESDYGDVLFFKAAAKGILSWILIQQAYDLNMDIDEANNNPDDNAEDFLADNPDFLTLTDSDYLNTAKGYLHSGLSDIEDAIDWITAETDDQTDDLINLMDNTPEEIDEARKDIAAAKVCLNGQCTVGDNDTPSDTSDDTLIDMIPFFAGINLRDLLPDIVEEDPTGFLPDPTFGGVLVKIEGDDPDILNDDLDEDGIADIFEDDIYYVYGGDDILEGFDNIRDNPEASGFQFLGAANSADGTREFTGTYTYYVVRVPEKSTGSEFFIDAIEFVENGELCCSLDWWSSDFFFYWWFPDRVSDRVSGWLYDGGFILMTAPSGTTGIRVYDSFVPINPKMTIETDKGDIIIEMFPDSAPNTVDHITDLVNQQFYDKMMINRVQADFVIQMGDPGCRADDAPVFPVGECDLSGGSGTTVGLEIDPNLTHKRGTVAMAHRTNDVNSNDSQFYICLNTTSCQISNLDGNFTIFGQVTSGMDVVDQISCTVSEQSIGKCVPGTGDFMNRVTVSQ